MKKLITLCLTLAMALTSTAQEWTLLTSASDLQAGDQIVIAYAAEEVTAAGELSTNGSKSSYWMAPIGSIFNGTELTTAASGTGLFTMEKDGNAWVFVNSNGNKLGATAAKKLSYTDAATATWNISITSDGEATIVNTNSAFGTLYYNSSSNSKRFCIYTSTNGMKPVQLYRYAQKPSVTIEFEGFPYQRTTCALPTFTAGSTYTLPTATPEKDGKTLQAWAYADQQYAPGASFVVPEENVVFVPVWDGEQAVENTAVRSHATKTLRDGQLVIVRDGKEFNVIGTRIK